MGQSDALHLGMKQERNLPPPLLFRYPIPFLHTQFQFHFSIRHLATIGRVRISHSKYSFRVQALFVFR